MRFSSASIAGPLLGDIDYGYLPIPKYNVKQSDYRTHVNMGAPVFVIPTTNANLNNTSVVLEALCYYSYENLMPVYYESCFSARYVPEEDSANMIKIAYNSKVYELGFIWKWGNFTDGVASIIAGGSQQFPLISTSARHTRKCH